MSDNKEKKFVSPVYNVIPVPLDKLRANDYNPNRVAPPEMKLLEISISDSHLLFLYELSFKIWDYLCR